MYVLINCEVLSCKHCYSGNAVIIFVDVVIHLQCVCAILSSVTCPALQYVSTLSHKRRDFEIKLLNTKCVLIFTTILSAPFIFVRKNE